MQTYVKDISLDLHVHVNMHATHRATDSSAVITVHHCLGTLHLKLPNYLVRCKVRDTKSGTAEKLIPIRYIVVGISKAIPAVTVLNSPTTSRGIECAKLSIVGFARALTECPKTFQDTVSRIFET